MSLLRIITPINLAEEEGKFFDSTRYQPQFRYDWSQRPTEQTPLLTAIFAQDTADISQQAERHFQVPWNDTLINAAQAEIQHPLTEMRPFNLDNLVHIQQQALKKLNIDYEVVVVDQHGFVARPEHKNKRLVISKYATYHFFSMESSVRHDGVHIIRYVNGEYNQIKRSSDYLSTEEGLASYMQDYGGDESNNSRFQHAAEYAVTAVCRRGSLREAVEYLISIGFPKKLAWQRAVRHKFGFVDTSQPGDIMKPAMYFAYSEKIKALTQDEQLRLFVGKIRLDELQNYPEYRGRWSKEELEEFFYETN